MRLEAAVRLLGQLAQHQPGVADDSYLDTAVVADLAAVEVDADEAGVGRKPRRAQKREHRVRPRTHHQHHVGLAKRHRARARKRARMVFGNHSAALRRGVKRQSGAVDEVAQFGGRPRPQHAAAGDDDRALGRGEQLNRAFHLHRVAGRPALDAVVDGEQDFFVVDLVIENVAGQVEVDRALLGVERLTKRDADVLRDAARHVDPVGCLHYRLHDRHLVHLLEGVERRRAHRRRTADRDYRGGVGPRVGESRERVGRAGARRRDAHARLAGDARVRVRHHRRRLLVAHIDALHPEIETGARGAAGRTAHHEKDRIDLFVSKAARDYLLASDNCHIAQTLLVEMVGPTEPPPCQEYRARTKTACMMLTTGSRTLTCEFRSNIC